jgi:molybdenum cofactor cytidylyltransferase
MNTFISAILLAAGESKRMGRPKLLLPFGSSTILEQSVDNLLNSSVAELILVVGCTAEQLLMKIANRPVKVAINRDYRRGMSASIKAGLDLVSDEAKGIMLALADQPFIDSYIINCLIEAFGIGNKGIVIPVYQGKRGHPVIFASKYKEKLLAVKDDVGGRQIIAEHPEDLFQMGIDSESVILDINTQRDYRALIAYSER